MLAGESATAKSLFTSFLIKSYLDNKEIENAKKVGYAIVEYEGRKIGGERKLKIPDLLADIKNYTYKILIDCPYECQINRLVSIYKPKNEKEKEILINKFLILRESFKKPEMIEAVNNIIELIKQDKYYEAAKLIEEKLYREHYMRNVKKINPDLIAKTYLEFHNQDKSAWSWEIELRTSVEKF